MSEPEAPQPQTIVAFWQKAGPELWFEKNDDFDREIKERFSCLVEEVAKGTHDEWLECADGALALILCLDQFPRNIHRGSGVAWHYDELARKKAETALNAKHDQAFGLPLKRFFYIPYMHSEKLEHQRYCLELCRRAGDEEGVKFAILHLEIIERFGRFPHRNDVLGRASTAEEEEYLSSGGFQG